MRRSMLGHRGAHAGVNRTRPLLKTGGTQAILGVKVLERCLDELHILKKIAPTKMAPQARRNLGQV